MSLEGWKGVVCTGTDWWADGWVDGWADGWAMDKSLYKCMGCFNGIVTGVSL